MIIQVLVLLIAAIPASGPEVIERSIAHHDPGALWPGYVAELTIRETRPSAPDRDTFLRIDFETSDMEIISDIDGTRIHRAIRDGECYAAIDGRTELTSEEKETHRLACERVGWYRDYYRYLWGLPMVLEDSGTIIDPEVTTARFDGEQTLRVRVSYEGNVGSDVWYFHFDPETYAMRGARFYHDESANDGEYIYFDEELDGEEVIVPRDRRWYYNNNDQFLGADLLQSVEIRKK